MNIIELICDPVSKASLLLSNDVLIGENSDFPIVNGIPVMLIDKTDQQNAVEVLKENKDRVGFSWALTHWFDLEIDSLLKNARFNEKLLLNFGSGSPLEKENIVKKGYEVVSIDINAGYSGVDIIADGHNLPLKSETFNVITAFEVLEHLHEPWNAIREINRVLKNGGSFVGSVAFLKEFHSSYFHMSHWGVLKLLDYGGFEVEVIYGGQDIFSRLVHNILPLGPSKFSKWIYANLDRFIMFGRKFYWSKKIGKSYKQKLSKFDPKFKFSFEEYEKIIFAPTVLFRARKIKSF